MNKIFVSLLSSLAICGAAQAADPVVGDAAAGQAKTAVCGACHGPDGNSLAPNFPKLAGQGQRYLLKQLHEIKDGKRVVLEMTGLLNNLNDQDLLTLLPTMAPRKAAWVQPMKNSWRAVRRCSAAASWTKACLPVPVATRPMGWATPRQVSLIWVGSMLITSRNN